MTNKNNNPTEACTSSVQVSTAISKDDLLPLLKQSIPSISSYKVVDTVVQANAEGFRVLVSHDDDKTTELFIKLIDASIYTHKKWADLRRTLLYARTEIRFYDEFLTSLRSKLSCGWPIAPDCYYAQCDLSGLVAEDESPSAVDALPAYHTASSSDDDDDDEIILKSDSFIGRGGSLLLKSINPITHMQHSPLTMSQASQCLAAAAKLHAAGWQDESLLQRASQRLCDNGGSYHLRIRNPNEIRDMEQSWAKFVSNFEHVAPSNFFKREGVKDLGKRIKDIAEYVSMELSPKPTDKYATIVHGDYKAMNIFIPRGIDDNEEKKNSNNNNNDCIIIDFASAGVGLGMSDVAMHIAHAVRPEDLRNGGEERLIDEYLDALRNSIEGLEYPRDIALRHYRLASIDYFRFILGRFWRSASVETFEKRKNSPNSTLVNRDLDAALGFVERVVTFLNDVEKEREV
mmetsp:Transcript_0/g.1  ORF Transcript_0/g.1 Transcript_0/m.1 type:complete len:459 (+) Transcript_0:74-1450(+)